MTLLRSETELMPESTDEGGWGWRGYLNNPATKGAILF